MGISKEELDYLAGVGVVERHYFANQDDPKTCTAITSLPSEIAVELWNDAVFDNAPLVKVELVWAPDEAKALAEREKDNG